MKAPTNTAKEPPTRSNRKVTYSLPSEVASELDRRTAGQHRAKSHVVAEALAFYFAWEDKKALAAVYEEAARDPLFEADNRAVAEDFAVLDDETLSEGSR